MSNCEKCGKPLEGNRKLCAVCERSIVFEGLNVGMKNPGFAAMFSLFIPGSGQVYLGEKTRGITFFVVTTLALVSIFFIGFIGMLMFFVIWLYNVYDAMKTGRSKLMKKMEQREKSV
jgi:TM2 domain-containing membrane protein YozV